MKYYILNKDPLTETDDESYNRWHNIFAKDLLLPDRVIRIEDKIHSIETMYHACFDKGDGLYPFVIIHFTDNMVISEDKIQQEYESDDTQYYETQAEFTSAYNKLISELEAKSSEIIL